MLTDRKTPALPKLRWELLVLRGVCAALLGLGLQACHSSPGSKVALDANAVEAGDSGRNEGEPEAGEASQDGGRDADVAGTGGAMGTDSAGGIEAGAAGNGGSSGSGGSTVADAPLGSEGLTGTGGDLGGTGGLPGSGGSPGAPIDGSDMDGTPVLSAVEVGSDSDGGEDSGNDVAPDSRDSANLDQRMDQSADQPMDSPENDLAASEAGREAGKEMGSEAGAIDGSVDGDSSPCCGCLCRDPGWSCSNDTCVDTAGHAMALAPEAGFFELAGGNYVSEGQSRVGPAHRVWYSFHPASVTPEDKPLAVFFNGGPGSATSAYLFSFNTGPYTLDPSQVGSGQIVSNPNNWAQFANLLHVDAPGTGFSYPMSLDGGSKPSVGIDLDRDAASLIRVVVRFLDRHPSLQANPVILVGESYGGTRAALMLDHLFNYQSLTTSTATYQDAALYNDLTAHFGLVFPQDNPATLSPAKVASQFGHQVLIQPVVAGSAQWNLNTPDASVCPLVQHDNYQCDQPTGWLDQNALLAATHLTTVATLHQALGVDPTTIEWLHARARTRAYGRSDGTLVSTPEMTTSFGTLGTDDNYFLVLNHAVELGYGTGSRWWTDPTIGVSFLNDLVYVDTFITNAKLDMVVWTPAIATALRSYTGVASSVMDSSARTGITRPGWIEVNFVHGVIPDPTSREIRFPLYPTAGHTVTARAPTELLADVMQWYPGTSSALLAVPGQTPAAARLPSSIFASSTAPTSALSEAHPFLGP